MMNFDMSCTFFLSHILIRYWMWY